MIIVGFSVGCVIRLILWWWGCLLVGFADVAELVLLDVLWFVVLGGGLVCWLRLCFVSCLLIVL